MIKIVLISGDGVGKEIALEVEKLLLSIETIAQKGKSAFVESLIKFDIQLVDISEEHFRKTGLLLPPGLEKMCKGARLVWLGPIIGNSSLHGYSDTLVIGELCKRLGLSIQSRRLEPLVSLQKSATNEPINFLVIQDRTLGQAVYGHLPTHSMGVEEFDIQTTYYSHTKIKNIFAMGERLIKSGEHHQLLLALPKELLDSDGPWMKSLKELSDNNIPVQVLPIERFFFQVFHNPQKLDLVITLPPFCQIFSRLSAVIEGGLGAGFDSYQNDEGNLTLLHILHPPSRRFVGKDAANPVGAFLSTGKMMNLIGQAKLEVLIRKIVNESIQSGWITRDLGGSMGTVEIGNYICSKLSEKLSPTTLSF